MVLEQRIAPSYEACHWIIGAEDKKYRDDTDAYIELFIDKAMTASAYVYIGTSRENSTMFIEGNSAAVVGVPYRAPISTKLIIVMTTEPNAGTSSAGFTYTIRDAIEYPIWFKPFVG